MIGFLVHGVVWLLGVFWYCTVLYFPNFEVFALHAMVLQQTRRCLWLDNPRDKPVGHLLLVPIPVAAVLFLAHVVVAQRSVDEQDRKVDGVKVPANTTNTTNIRGKGASGCQEQQTILLHLNLNLNLRRHDETVRQLNSRQDRMEASHKAPREAHQPVGCNHGQGGGGGGGGV